MDLTFVELKEKHRNLRDNWTSENAKTNAVRIHRALSWIKSAEENTNNNMAFISLWIAFNALYGCCEEANQKHSPERKSFKDFFAKVIPLDTGECISGEIWAQYTVLFKNFIENKFVCEAFWLWQYNEINEAEFTRRFENDIDASKRALSKQDSVRFLGILFDRMYILRNQIFHGCATYDSNVNKDQLDLGVKILRRIIPILTNLLMENPEQDWGNVAYPVVE